MWRAAWARSGIAQAVVKALKRCEATKRKETLLARLPGYVLVVVLQMSDYALPVLNPACSICSRAASAVEWMPCTLSLKSSGLLAFSKAVS